MSWDFPPGYRLVPRPFLAERITRAAGLAATLDLGGLLFTSVLDVYYLCGTSQQGVVLIRPSGEAQVFIRRHAGRAAAESPLAVQPVSGLSQVAAHLEGLGRLGMALDVTPARDYLIWQERLPRAELVDITAAWLDLKAVKDPFEQERLKEAGALAKEVYRELPRLLKPGRSEAQVAGELLALALARGHIDQLRQRSAYFQTYSWHVVSGASGAWPSAIEAPFGGVGFSPAFPQGASHKPLAPGEPIIVDFGICLGGYQCDQTRTYCLGPAPPVLRRAHAALEAVEKAILAALRPGAVSGEIFELAVETADAQGMSACFLGRPPERIPFVGHGIGLEMGSVPYLLKSSKARVRAGEAYALELKIVLDQGPVGLENSVLVAPQGPPLVLMDLPSRLMELPV